MEKETLKLKDVQPYGVNSLASSVIEDASRRLGFANDSLDIPPDFSGPCISYMSQNDLRESKYCASIQEHIDSTPAPILWPSLEVLTPASKASLSRDRVREPSRLGLSASASAT